MERFTIISVVLVAVFVYFFQKYLRRYFREWHARRHPGSYRAEYGRYYGRFLFAGIALAVSLGMVALAAHLERWERFDSSATIGRVETSRSGEGMSLDLQLTGVEPRTVELEGRLWIVRVELLYFSKRLGFLGLHNYYRVRAVDGLAERQDRLQGTYQTREVLNQESPLFQALQRMTFLSFLVRSEKFVSPLKKAGEDADIWVIPGGTAG